MTSAAHLVLGGLREINLQIEKDLCSNSHYVVPGQKLCPQCRRQATIKSEGGELDFETNIEEPVDCNIISLEEEVQLDSTRESLNNNLCELDLSRLKVHSVAPLSKTSLGKRKLNQLESAFTKKLASVLKVNETGFDTEVRKNINAETQMNADYLDYLVQSMKEKIKVASRRKRL